jgi:hypothetical protein
MFIPIAAQDWAQLGTRTVAAAILGCRGAGASSPAETGVHCHHRVLLGKESFLPGGWEARPLRQAGMPDATTVRVPSCAPQDFLNHETRRISEQKAFFSRVWRISRFS